MIHNFHNKATSDVVSESFLVHLFPMAEVKSIHMSHINMRSNKLLIYNMEYLYGDTARS